MRDETQGGEGSERMGGTVTARIRVEMGEVRVTVRVDAHNSFVSRRG